MASSANLGDFEQIVMLAILRLGGDAYGVTIRAEISARANRESTPGALYTTLERLEAKGMVTSRLGDSTPQRGGRPKRYFEVTQAGSRALAQAQKAYQNLLRGLQLPGVICA